MVNESEDKPEDEVEVEDLDLTEASFVQADDSGDDDYYEDDDEC